MPPKPRIDLVASEVLAEGWAVLKRITLDYRRRDGRTDRQVRLNIDHGDAAAVLPYDPDRGVVLLVRQFRLAAYLNVGVEALIEACAGRLDGDDPAVCAHREAEEELGYRLATVEPAVVAFPSPGLDQERIHCFLARYAPQDRIHDGGGLVSEGEDIEVIEMDFAEAFAAIAAGRIVDAKTILLLQHLKLTGLMG